MILKTGATSLVILFFDNTILYNKSIDINETYYNYIMKN